MAITLDFVKNGVTVSGAYVRLMNVAGSKRNGWTGRFYVYASPDQAWWFDEFDLKIPFEPGQDVYNCMYNAAKIEYPTATDC